MTDASPARIRRRALVEGHVQGVFFRATTRRQARELGLSGWVRNLPDGRVEVVAEGRPAAVEALLDWARSGPPNARVRQLAVSAEPPTGTTEPFTVRY